VGLRKGDMAVASSGIEGIVLEFRYSQYNSYYHKTLIYCTYAPRENYMKVNTIFEINSSILKRKVNQ